MCTSRRLTRRRMSGLSVCEAAGSCQPVMINLIPMMISSASTS